MSRRGREDEEDEDRESKYDEDKESYLKLQKSDWKRRYLMAKLELENPMPGDYPGDGLLASMLDDKQDPKKVSESAKAKQRLRIWNDYDKEVEAYVSTKSLPRLVDDKANRACLIAELILKLEREVKEKKEAAARLEKLLK